MLRSIKFYLIISSLITVAAVSFNCKSDTAKSGKTFDSVRSDSSNNQRNPQMGEGMMNGGMMNSGMMGRMMSSNNSSNTNSSHNWTAPSSSKKLVNSLRDIVEASKLGREIYNQQCVTCHGKDATGDGPTGTLLNPRPANLISEQVQSQTDGEIFWKISNGKSPMPAFRNSLSKKQRWELVDYIRSLKKN